jgi:myosin heavy subunit
VCARTGILHLGQVKFDTRADLTGDSGVVADLQPLEQAARLLGVSQELLETALIKKKSLVIRGA